MIVKDTEQDKQACEVEVEARREKNLKSESPGAGLVQRRWDEMTGIRGNNWRATEQSESSLKDLISSIESADAKVFNSCSLYYGSKGTIVLHLGNSIRDSQVRSLIHLDWKRVRGSLEDITANLKKVEDPIQFFQFPSSGDNTSKNDSEVLTDPHIAEREDPDMPTGEMVSALPHVDENAVVFENEEKKLITEQLLKIHRALSRGAVPTIINADTCRLIADRLIEEGKEAEESNKHYINKLRQKIAELETKNLRLERAYNAMDQMIKEQGIEARHQRRAKAARRPQHGWNNSASKWIDSSVP